MMWLSWRHQLNKPLCISVILKNKDLLNVLLVKSLTDFLEFKNASRFLEASCNYFLPYSFLLETSLNETRNSQAAVLDTMKSIINYLSMGLMKVADWIIKREPGAIDN